MNPVEVVIINWRRGPNVEIISAALRSQSVPCTLTLIDAHEPGVNILSPECLARFDRIIPMPHNYGCWNRMVPLGAYDHEYTMFLDDDVIPSPNMVMHYLSCAQEKRDQFAVLGLVGRRIYDGRYLKSNVLRSAHHFVPVDIMVRTYFVRTEHLHWCHFELRRWKIELPFFDDDILMCAAITVHTGLRSYLTPIRPNDPDIDTKWETLAQNDAVWRHDLVAPRRDKAVRLALENGYIPI